MTDNTTTLADPFGMRDRHAWMRSAAPWMFGGAMLLSATLVFSIQPMFAKMVLPRLGGGAAVWTVALVFFQGALLAGYCYAHLLTSRLSLGRQIGVHACVLAVAAMFLPIGIAQGFDAPPDSWQSLWLIALFTASVGVPFAAISATAPLLQSWFSRTGRADAADPYYLYGASNAGSLAALLAFPLLIEPQLGAHAQSLAWSVGFVALIVGILACAALVWRRNALERVETVSAATERSTLQERLKWTLLGLLPSALLVGATTYISTDVASAPLLWVIPLALYLSAFILAFRRRTWIPATATTLALPILAAVTLVIGWAVGDWRLVALSVLATLWLGSYVCCRALYDARPDANRLTDFYLWMSLGGVVGGGLAALLAPVVFDSVLEWPIAIALTLLALPANKKPSRPIFFIFAGCLAITLGAAALAALGMAHERVATAGLAAGLCAMLVGRSHRALMTLACVSIIAMSAIIQQAAVTFADRSFYGAVRVLDTPDGQWRRFAHGTTIHGVQSLDPALRTMPTGYYGLDTPIGTAVRALNAAGRLEHVAVLGLGAGAMACYARAGQDWTFYEIDPLVVRVAQDRRLFTFLSDCSPNAGVIVGDARLELAKQPPQAYDLVLADAFSSDSVPTHMLTREAMELYLSRVTADGVVLIHVSNRNLALADVVARAAQSAGAVVIQRLYMPERQSFANTASEVVAIARTHEALAPLLADPTWTVSAPPPGRVWTDDYSNILEPLAQRWAEPLHLPTQ
jgi:hypothetical protein